MNYYEKCVNSFLSSVSTNMSAVYLPTFFVSLIKILQDYYRFDVEMEGIIKSRTRLYIPYPLVAAYFIHHLLNIRNEVPAIKLAPTRGLTHEERFMIGVNDPVVFPEPKYLYEHPLFKERYPALIRGMKQAQNVIQVFEKRCPIVECKRDSMEMDIAAANTLLTNSILYTRMSELISYQYLLKLPANSEIKNRIENYFIRSGERVPFTSTARQHVIEYQEWKCYYCTRKLKHDTADAKPRADHFIPWVFVKHSHTENLVYACNRCNTEKLDRLPKLTYFNRLLKRNAPESDFWTTLPENTGNLDKRIERWVRNFYQASEQLSTGWAPEHNIVS